jgi:hypothetical protein
VELALKEKRIAESDLDSLRAKVKDVLKEKIDIETKFKVL